LNREHNDRYNLLHYNNHYTLELMVLANEMVLVTKDVGRKMMAQMTRMAF
jgi:hypothetical protein